MTTIDLHPLRYLLRISAWNIYKCLAISPPVNKLSYDLLMRA